MIQTIKPGRRQNRIRLIGILKTNKLPDIERRGSTAKDILPQDVSNMARMVGQKRAKEVNKLRKSGIEGTLPELCTYLWLQDAGLNFSFQYPLLGGRAIRGGAVVDFIIWNLSPNGYYIWRIQGDYWHTGHEVEKKDEVQKFRLAALKLGGIPIVDVIDLWESRIYKDYPNVFLKAEIGIELGRMV